MPSIKVLSREIAELISAGEVIERPSSVIKELIENSIDSGARHITVEIKNGGTSYMRVTDDGCGMTFDDVPRAFLRHATSKISGKQDLENICTFGFRGEALASVSAVARVEATTKLREENFGTLYRIEGCEELSHEKTGCPDGTTLIIRDLFYNVPARRKFMKKDVTEANAVSQIVQKTALSHPEVSFKMIRDGRMELSSSGDGELFSAVYAVYGRDFARDMMAVDYKENGIHIKGYAVKPLYSKNNRSFQNFFVNGRYVRSKICSVALESAYENLIMTGKFPACVLMVEISPTLTDVNIHPSKAEIRFTNEKQVSDAVFSALKDAMLKDGLIYEFELEKKPETVSEDKKPISILTPVDEIEKTEKKLAEKTAVKENICEEEDEEEIPETAGFEACSAYSIKTEKVQEKKIAEISAPTENFSYISEKTYKPLQSPQEENIIPLIPEVIVSENIKIKVIGEVFGLYIIAETSDDKLIIIDKHASHERILFEKLKSRNCRQYAQSLFSPVKILLTAEEFGAMEENKELLEDMGFLFDFSANPCISAQAVPTFVTEENIESVISEIAENLRLYRQNPQSHVLDDMLHDVACKSAIRANDKNSIQELQSLAEQVYYNEKIRHCPHGRPVMFTMTKSNISHQFKRT